MRRRPSRQPDGAESRADTNDPDRRHVGWAGGGRAKVLGALASVLIAGALIVVLVSTSTGSSRASTTASAITGSATAVVQRRDLVDTDSETGTIGYSDVRDVYNQMSGTVTWLPATGAVVPEDGVLYRVDGKGVYLFNGTVPAYRSFKSGMSDGADVAELNRSLRALGDDPDKDIDLSDARHFSTATTDAVERWQKAHGMSQTGTIALGRIVFLPGARRIEEVDLSIGGPASSSASGGSSATGTSGTAGSSTGSGSGSSSTTDSAYKSAAQKSPEYVSYVTKLPAAVTSTTTSTTTTPTTTTTTTTPTTTTTTTPTTTTTQTRTTPTGPRTTPSTPSTTSKSKTTTSKTTTSKTAPATSSGSYSGSGGSTGTASSSGSTGTSGGSSSSTGTSGSSSSTGTSGSSSSTGTSGTSTSTGTSSSSTAAQSAGNVALETTSTGSVVTVPLDTSKETEAVVGTQVQVTLPSTRIVNGRITSVASVATATSSSSSSSTDSSGSTSSTVNVGIALDHQSADAKLDQAPVTVAFAQQTEKNALSVPVTALVATAGGGYAVDEVVGTTRHLVPVTPGLYAGGYVSITGNVSAGAKVTDGSE